MFEGLIKSQLFERDFSFYHLKRYVIYAPYPEPVPEKEVSCGQSIWKGRIFKLRYLKVHILETSSLYFFLYHDFSIGTGRPTRMKNLANACDKCSLYGGSRRNLARFRCTSRDSRKERGTVNTSWKYVMRLSILDSPIRQPFNMVRFHTNPLQISLQWAFHAFSVGFCPTHSIWLFQME